MPHTKLPLTATLPKDISAGLVVLLVAMPLCLGVALASNAPLFSGILSGIIGEAKNDVTQQKQLLWHSALEIGFQRDLCMKITQGTAPAPAEPKMRPVVQAVFCIDVRFEVMRRSLEAASPEIETMGLPIEYIPFGQRHGTSRVPVLFSPKYRVREHRPQATPEQEKDARKQLQVGLATIIRACYSKWPVRELLVDCLHNHFNVKIDSENTIRAGGQQVS